MSDHQEKEAYIRELEKRVAKLEKINAVLIRAAEGRTQMEQSAFDLFKTTSVLEEKVKERTARLVEAQKRLQTANRYLAALHETTIDLISHLELEELLQTIIARAGSLLGTEHGFVYLRESNEPEMQVRIGIGAFANLVGMRTKQGTGLAGVVWETGQPLVVDDYHAWPGRLPDPHFDILHAVVGVPLKSGEAVIGVIGLAYLEEGRLFGSPELDALTRFAALVSTAVDNVQLFQQAQRELEKRKRAEEALVYSTLHDPLTDLPNRTLFMDRLGRALERAKRHKDYVFAVLYLDLDRFKVVNDSLGHNIGDKLLIESARRLSACLRTLDTVARLGGDEFVILLEDIQGITEATHIADRIQHDIALPCELDHHKVFVSVSIGVVLSATGYDQLKDIMRDADMAMYRAKGLGRGRYEVFDAAMRDRAMTRLETETDLRLALERQEFFIHYQPIVSLQTRRIVGFEALVRWQHPNRGTVMPAEFIPVAEETGLIVPIDQWVLFEACRQMREWQTLFPAEPPLTISVNLSARQFGQPDLVEKTARVLKETGLDASSLKLELTESTIIEDSEAVSTLLLQLRTLGVQVQIDDFGTGYSSLGYLHRLPIDTLKIDRTFIGKIGANGNGSEIVRTIMVLAHELGMKVIAEGVETTEQLAKLLGFDCEYGQGFLFARPVDCKTAAALIAGVSVAA
jgi:diguanylate cyclase (GGDEF)-like protein